MVRLIVYIIEAYQRSLSPDHGWLKARYPYGYCRFHPTCSEYCKQALLTHGLLRGLVLGARRLARCHPWGAWGIDPVPPLHK